MSSQRTSFAYDELPEMPEGNRELLGTADGDHQAFQQLYKIFASRIFGVARSVSRDATAAEDVTQEVFLEIWRKAARFDPAKGSANAWIMTIARSRAIDRVRAIQVSRQRDSNWGVRQGDRDRDTVVESVLLGFDQHEVRTVLSALTGVQREAVVLAYFSGLNSAEIAELLGIARGTAKTRIRDGLMRMRKELTVAA